ncbi:MAG: DUF4177 domain-containing protein [Aureispira sp.]
MSDIQQFEYKTITHLVKRTLFSKRKSATQTNDLETQLDQLGKIGWELTGQFTQEYSGFTDKVVFIFKRPLLAFSDEEE